MTGKERLDLEIMYMDKYMDLMDDGFLMDGEVVKQCHAPYPPYWFVTNKGRVFSVHKKKLQELKIHARKTGHANKSGERAGISWYVIYIDPDNNIQRHADIHRIVAEHFLEDEFPEIEGDRVVHHIKKRSTFREDEASECNCADNLQILPDSIHRALTHESSKTQAELDSESEERAKKSGCPCYELTQAQMQAILQQSLISSMSAFVIIKSNDDDVSQIKTAVYPVKNIIVTEE